MGVHWKIWLLRGESRETNIEGRDCLKSGAWIVCWFKGGLGKKEEVVFLRGGGVETPMHFMSGFTKSLKKVRDKVDFLHAGKH